MHTLILNGSPRPFGDTAALIAALREGLRGRVTQVDCCRARISPCLDCRRCAKEPGCAVHDEMDVLYPVIERCDRVVIATPVYFSLPTPQVLSVCSRLQTYFCAKFFRKESSPILPKRGGILLCGGGSGSAAPAEAAVRRMLKALGAGEIGPVAASLNTDRLPAREDAAALAQAAALAEFLNAGASVGPC